MAGEPIKGWRLNGRQLREGDVCNVELQNEFGSFEFHKAVIIFSREMNDYSFQTLGNDSGSTGFGGLIKILSVLGNWRDTPELIEGATIYTDNNDAVAPVSPGETTEPDYSNNRQIS